MSVYYVVHICNDDASLTALLSSLLDMEVGYRLLVHSETKQTSSGPVTRFPLWWHQSIRPTSSIITLYYVP